jgi:hypothetical protein
MQSQEIAAELIKSPSLVRAAFAIMASHDALRTQLLTSLAVSLQHPLPGLVGAVHEQWGGFFEKTQGKPFLVRRQIGATAAPANWPWGRFAIGLEFDRGRLFYGIRFDESGWHPSSPDTIPMPENAAADLAHQLGTNSCRWEYWPWWQWANVANDEALCLSIVDGTLLAELTSKIQRLTEVLDLYCKVPSLPVAN